MKPVQGPKPSWKVFFSGMLGGAIDASPSISGATVYYVIGIYKDLLESISRAWSSFFEALRERSFSPILSEGGWRFLFVLKGGVVLSFLLFAKIILFCLQNEAIRPFLYSLFFGFVAGSSVICLKNVREWLLRRFFLVLAGAGIGFFIVYAHPLSSEKQYSVSVTMSLPAALNVDATHTRLLHVPYSALGVLQGQDVLDIQKPIVDEETDTVFEKGVFEATKSYFFRFPVVCMGLLVACAMLLPGVSGSYVLNVFGYYSQMLFSVSEIVSGLFLFQFPLNAWTFVLNLGLGVALGLGVFSRAVLHFFEKYPCSTQAFLAGGMCGSIFCLWPFQKLGLFVDPFHVSEGLVLKSMEKYLPSLHECFGAWYLFIGAIFAFCAVFLLQRLAAKKMKG